MDYIVILLTIQLFYAIYCDSNRMALCNLDMFSTSRLQVEGNDRIKVKVCVNLSRLTYHVIACTVQCLQLQHSSKDAFQFSHRKNHLEVHPCIIPSQFTG